MRVLADVDRWIDRFVSTATGYRRRRAIWLFAIGVKPKLAAQRLACSRQTYRLDVQAAVEDILAGMANAR
jgi:hypothetical protein